MSGVLEGLERRVADLEQALIEITGTSARGNGLECTCAVCGNFSLCNIYKDLNRLETENRCLTDALEHITSDSCSIYDVDVVARTALVKTS